MERSFPGLMPLVVGVTGHRELRDTPEDRAALTASLRRLFQHLTMWPHWPRDRAPSPLWLMTPLAEGADRFVAQVALEFGARLIAVLPFAREEYEKDFAVPGRTLEQNAHALAEFRELIDGPHTMRVIELPAVANDDVRLPARRDLQYALMGAYIARQSQIFVALWDGNPPEPNQLGGTADIVNFRRTGQFGVLSPLLATELAAVPAPFGLVNDGPAGAVHHIVTPRASGAMGVSLKAYDERLLVPEPFDRSADTRRAYVRQMDHMEREIHLYNHAVSVLSPHRRLPDDVTEGARLPKTQHLDADGEMLQHAAMAADRVVWSRAHWTRRALSWGVLLGVLVIALLALYTLQAESGWSSGLDRKQVIALAVLAVACVEAVYAWFHARAARARTRAYRWLADGLRTQLFWRAAGWRNAVADSYPTLPKREWVRTVLRAWGVV